LGLYQRFRSEPDQHITTQLAPLQKPESLDGPLKRIERGPGIGRQKHIAYMQIAKLISNPIIEESAIQASPEGYRTPPGSQHLIHRPLMFWRRSQQVVVLNDPAWLDVQQSQIPFPIGDETPGAPVWTATACEGHAMPDILTGDELIALIRPIYGGATELHDQVIISPSIPKPFPFLNIPSKCDRDMHLVRWRPE